MTNLNLPETYEFENTTRDQPFEPFYSFSPPENEKVAEYFLTHCDAAMPRKRKRRSEDLANFKLVLTTVVANAFRATQNRPSKLVYYSRRAETFTSDDIYLPPFLRYTNLMHAVDALTLAGFLESNRTPSRKSSFPCKGAPQSTFGATDKLLAALHELGLTEEAIVRNQNAPVFILKDTEKKLEHYNSNTPFIKSMITTIREYNAFLDLIDLTLDMTRDEQRVMYEVMAGEGKPRSPVNFNDRHLRRIFNNSSFEQGGRWYGGWWQLIPSEYRSQLLIDGEETAELDYSGCFPRMLYHLDGKNNQENDLYFIKELADAAEAQGLSWESVRASIKKLTNILINAGPNHRIGKISGLTLPKGFKQPKKKVYPLIEKKHEDIAHWFRSGAGLQLMNRESAICEAILTEGVTRLIPVLPVHDSFVVQNRHRTWLRDAMVSCYRDEVGFEPIIKAKDVKKDDNQLDQLSDKQVLIGDFFKNFSLEETVSSEEAPLRYVLDDEEDVWPTNRRSKGPIIIGPGGRIEDGSSDAVFESLMADWGRRG